MTVVRELCNLLNLSACSGQSVKNYFQICTILHGDDSKLEAIWKQEHPLKEFTEESNFKSYDELKNKLHEVLKGDIRGKAPTSPKTAEDVEDVMVEKPSILKSKAPKQEVDEETDALEYFQKLAEE